jgi:hypothetical protein
MNEFVLVFRRNFKTKEAQPAGEYLQAYLKHWHDWFLCLAALERLAIPVQRWDASGKLLKHDKSVVAGPYTAMNESVGGLIVIKATDYPEASEIAKGCPILELGGTVEIRMEK